MTVVDFVYAQFIKCGQDVGSKLIEEAKGLMQDDPKEAGRLLVTAWVVLNGVAAVCRLKEMHTYAAKIETLRQRIKFMGGELTIAGYPLITDIPDSQMAFVITPKEPTKG